MIILRDLFGRGGQWAVPRRGRRNLRTPIVVCLPGHGTDMIKVHVQLMYNYLQVRMPKMSFSCKLLFIDL